MTESMDISQPTLYAHYSNHERRITDICFNSASRLFTSSLDGTCMDWHLNSLHQSTHVCYNAHKEPVLGVCYNTKSNCIATCSTDKTVKLFTPNKKEFSPHSILHSDKLRGLDINEDKQILATISDDNAVKIWDLEKAKCKYSHMIAVPSNCWFRSVKINPAGTMVATAGQDRRIRVYDIRTRLPVQNFKENTGVPRKICWHPENYLLAAAFNDNSIKIFNVCEGDVLQVYDVHAAPVNDISFHPNGMFLAATCDDKSVKILDLMIGQPLYTLIGHNAPVNSVKFNTNGDLLASGDDTGHLLIWKTNLDTYNRERFAEKSTNSETMNAGGEIDDDKSIVVDQRRSKNYTNTAASVVNSHNVEKNKKKFKYMPPSRIPISCYISSKRYEIDDY